MRYVCLITLVTTGILTPADASDSTPYEVRKGLVKFSVNTNLSAISVHGQSSEMKAKFTLKQQDNALTIVDFQAVVDPKSLSTGMSLRDHHMRSKVFATENDTLPELRFQGANLACPAPASGREITCDIQGEMHMRDKAQPFTFQLKIRKDSKGEYRAQGDGMIQLTKFGVEPPCQLGVCVANDVKLHVEFQAAQNGLVAGASR